MNAAELAQLITSAATLIAALATWRGVKNVVKHTNSMKDELVSEVRKSSFQDGVKQQKDHPDG